MFLARVEGSVVATKKEASMNGRKLVLLRPQLVDEKDPTRLRPGVNTIVAVDSIGAGAGELVIFCQGSSAGLPPVFGTRPSMPSSSALSIRWMSWENRFIAPSSK